MQVGFRIRVKLTDFCMNLSFILPTIYHIEVDQVFALFCSCKHINVNHNLLYDFAFVKPT